MTETPSSSPGNTTSAPGEEPLDEIKSLLFSSTSSTSSLDTTYTLSILHKALSHPRIFAGYAELSTHPQIISCLQESKLGQQMLNTLHLFAFGMYGDYAAKDADDNKDQKYCTLNATEALKLRVLTIITLVQQQQQQKDDFDPKKNKNKKKNKKKKSSTTSSVPYSLLYTALGMDPNNNIRQLEDVLIHAIYTHAIIGKLDQRNMCLQILPSSSSSSTSGVGGAGGSGFMTACRDVDVEKDVSVMIQELEAFYNKGVDLVSSLEGCVEEGQKVREEDLVYWMNVEQVIGLNRMKVSKNMSLAGVGVGGGERVPTKKGGKGVSGGGMMLAEEGLMAAAAAAAESGGGGNAQMADWLAASGGGSGGDVAAVAMAAAAGEVAGGGSTRARQSKRSRG